jgi:eukaryotic-like serine/threonine-protein kinase
LAPRVQFRAGVFVVEVRSFAGEPAVLKITRVDDDASDSIDTLKLEGKLLGPWVGATADPREAERTGRACLLAPCSAGEMMRARALIDRALADEKRHSPTWVLPYFYFAKGLAEYRSGRLENTIYLMEGDASRVLGPAPRLVLAMVLHGRGRKDEARNALASASASFGRKAERTILPGLSDFLAGKAEPQHNDERLALLGVCQFTNRNRVLVRLYTSAFSADPQLRRM